MLIELNLWRVIISDDDMFDVNGMNQGDGSWCEVKRNPFSCQCWNVEGISNKEQNILNSKVKLLSHHYNPFHKS